MENLLFLGVPILKHIRVVTLSGEVTLHFHYLLPPLWGQLLKEKNKLPTIGVNFYSLRVDPILEVLNCQKWWDNLAVWQYTNTL